jgi:hypothetical protein
MARYHAEDPGMADTEIIGEKIGIDHESADSLWITDPLDELVPEGRSIDQQIMNRYSLFRSLDPKDRNRRSIAINLSSGVVWIALFTARETAELDWKVNRHWMKFQTAIVRAFTNVLLVCLVSNTTAAKARVLFVLPRKSGPSTGVINFNKFLKLLLEREIFGLRWNCLQVKI